MAKKDKGLVVDFSKVTEGGGSNKRIKAGTYLAEMSKDWKVSESSNGNTMITVTWVIQEGKYEGTKLKDRFVLTEKALFRLYNMLNAMGKNPKKEKQKLNPGNWVGGVIAIDVEDDSYDNNDGKTILTSSVAGYINPDELTPDGGKKKSKKSKEEAPAKKGKKGKKSKDDESVDEVDLDDEL